MPEKITNHPFRPAPHHYLKCELCGQPRKIHQTQLQGQHVFQIPPPLEPEPSPLDSICQAVHAALQLGTASLGSFMVIAPEGKPATVIIDNPSGHSVYVEQPDGTFTAAR